MPQPKKKPARTSTRADIEAYFNAYWGRMTDQKNELRKIALLPELSPPTWLVSFKTTYEAGTPHEHTAYREIIVLQKTSATGVAYLNLPEETAVPEGLANVAEEDAEMAERKAAEEAEIHKRWEARREQKGQTDGSDEAPQQ